ncbi:bifunctional polysaccharide deacetylase/glycosyltransferase family 2 protein [Catellatospora citrea]|uniref:Bi-functional transferase/deacetylase n=1 Tax=Catellatospora citrea TaxID=53366 RepID=A0A8J3P038_9ACTN|nr:bifunctional polysaccharide deacetylase/glycosyltransferase family 2 protein [Catellatospora citrea]RKE05640.1 cellulose synthase/poly-beta-1,6-N-acetylglucosamine synthase-like glycosyltransferase [Catellatospora citrea]GIF96995.1 bi-functional transferase/deacetylase [Catellatospora citrea]
MTLYASSSRPAGDPTTTGFLSTRRPAGRGIRILLLLTLLVIVAALLFVEAYANASFAPDASSAPGPAASAVPAAIRDGGPVIAHGGAKPRTWRPAKRTVALTFDDGPDPTWTPRILDVLARTGTRATFFVVGSQVARYPDLARRIVAEGHEIGVHTFSHPDLSAIPAWQRDLEYSQTQLAIAYATGVTTSLFRPPYSSSTDAIRDNDWQVMREATTQGYLNVLEDVDSRDWARPGTQAITANATPADGRGAIVLLHDAGGDRSQTVAALERYIPAMHENGYHFTTVSRSLQTPIVTPVNPPATAGQRWRGGALVWTIRVADGLMVVLWWLLVVVGVLTLARTLLLFAVAVRHARRRRAPAFTWGPPVHEPVSVIVPAFNEQDTIAATVRTLAASDHPGVEIIVVDDASTDATAAAVDALGIDDLRLVRVPSGGKALALNTGVALARHDLIVMVDADTVVEPDALRQLVQPFADPAVGAVAGNVKVGNRRRLLPRWQHIEYVIGFNLDRRLYDALGCIPTIPGALGAFRRQALTDAGGLSIDTLAEDTDLTMAILRAGWRVVYQEDAHSHTEAPTTLRQLWQQRYRWSYGTMQAMWKHRRSLIERGASGRFGRRGLPLIALFSVVLPLFGPILDLMTVFGVFFLDRSSTLIGWLAVLAVQAVTAVLAFRLDREPLRPLWALPLQQFAYRQIMYAVLLRSAITAVAGRRLRWQKLERSAEVAAGTR